MAFLLKINAARRLSGSEGRRPALSFSSYGEAFKASREIFGYLAEHTTRAARFLFRATCYGLFLFACYGVKYWPVWPGTLVFLGLLALALAAHFAAESLN